MPLAAIDYIAPYPVLLIVLLIGAGIVASRKRITAHADGIAARASPDRFTRGLMRFVAHGAVVIGWLWVAVAAIGIVFKLAGAG